jgi:hypothetical protein
LKKEEEQTMKRKVKFLVGVLLILALGGCAETKHTVYELSGWEPGQIINLQYADKVVVVEDYNFEYKTKSVINLFTTKTFVFKGNAAECILAELRGTIPGYAVIREEDLKNVKNPTQIVRVKPVDISIKYIPSELSYYASMKVEVYRDGKTKTISAKDKDPIAREALTKVCEKIAIKINKVFEKK